MFLIFIRNHIVYDEVMIVFMTKANNSKKTDLLSLHLYSLRFQVAASFNIAKPLYLSFVSAAPMRFIFNGVTGVNKK